jgi:tight adherence protein B
VTVPRLGALALVLGAAAAGAADLGRRRARRRRRTRTGGQVLEVCEVLAGELVAGRPPGVALERAASCWPSLRPAAAAFAVGGDVPQALRELAVAVDGAGDLRVVAAAWDVAHRTGQGLGDAVERVGETLRAAAATRRVVEAELGSARATARLVTGLPLLALALGSGAGGDPWVFLLTEPAGIACLAGGLAFGLAGLWWIEAIAADVEAGA